MIEKGFERLGTSKLVAKGEEAGGLYTCMYVYICIYVYIYICMYVERVYAIARYVLCCLLATAAAAADYA